MNSEPNLKEQKLWQLTVEFCSISLTWEERKSKEREPAYTKRVLLPQFQSFVKDINDKQLRLNSDGAVTPLPVTLTGAQDFYPDISLDLYGKRGVALEVKYLPSSHYSDRLAKAIGQAIIYSTFGYTGAIVLLVSKTGQIEIPEIEIERLNESLSANKVMVQLLHKHTHKQVIHQ
jgi:hypothetical protein